MRTVLASHTLYLQITKLTLALWRGVVRVDKQRLKQRRARERGQRLRGR